MFCCCYKALASAGSILTSGYEQLRKCQEAVSATRHTSADFHHELLRLRQHWRLKKVGSTIIGDLSYKSGMCITFLLVERIETKDSYNFSFAVLYSYNTTYQCVYKKFTYCLIKHLQGVFTVVSWPARMWGQL